MVIVPAMKPWPTQALARIPWAQGWPLAVLLVAGLAIGLWLGNEFGATYDEKLNANNGAAALRAYQGSDDYFDLPALPDHGPVYFMIMSIASALVEDIAPQWSRSDGRHLPHFFMFLGATAGFYLLCLRLSGKTTAWTASVLFFTQPLLLGHGFINQKDTPFMAFFLATFVTGILAGDRLARSPSHSGTVRPPDPGMAAQIASQWRALAPSAKWLHGGITLGLLLLATDLLLARRPAPTRRGASELGLRQASAWPAPERFRLPRL
jgi:4-amino-4-deoxy-L-arabinose transferase-like glycosyltransferase